MSGFPDIEYELKKWSPYHVPPVHDRYQRNRGENHFTYSTGDTTFILQGTGLGDLMIIRQFGRAIHDFFISEADPELGEVVITTGAGPPAFNPDEGDVNLYWWWSFGHYDSMPEQYLDYYLDKTAIKPDVVLCPSARTEREAQQAGFETVRFPLGTYSFEPKSELKRGGFGYAGSPNHKQNAKGNRVIGPFAENPNFEWVTHFRFPEELSLWYNQKMVTFGLHREGQRTWGMVNNRVFETLASGTPFILEAHPTVNDVLGFEYPYQTSSKAESKSLVNQIQENPESTFEEFHQYSELVRKKHSYYRRVETLVDYLS
jgi:hypothetical protein